MKKIISIFSLMIAFSIGYSYGQGTTITTTTTTTTEEPAKPAQPAPQAPATVITPAPPATVITPAPNVNRVAVVDDDIDHNEHFTRGYIGGMVLATFTDIHLKGTDGSTIETSTTLGYGGGGMLGVYLSRHFNLELDILYSSLSQKYKNTFNTNDRLKVSYINIPLLLGLNTDASKLVNLNVSAGPQLGLNVGSSLEHADAGSNVDTVHAILSVRKGDIGIAFGASLDFNIANALKLSIGYRGVRGLLDISDNNQNLTTGDYYILDRSHVNTNSAYAGLAVMF